VSCVEWLSTTSLDAIIVTVAVLLNIIWYYFIITLAFVVVRVANSTNNSNYILSIMLAGIGCKAWSVVSGWRPGWGHQLRQIWTLSSPTPHVSRPLTYLSLFAWLTWPRLHMVWYTTWLQDVITCPDFTKFFIQCYLWENMTSSTKPEVHDVLHCRVRGGSSQGHCGLGSILLWRQCNTSCTSGFVDDVMFAHKWGKQRYRPLTDSL